MRRSVALAAFAFVVVGLGLQAEAKAQINGVGVGADPFSFYYGYYLPHAQYIASQPNVLEPINRVTANRQAAAAADRSELYDPVSPYGEDELDPLRPFNSSKGERGRNVRARGVAQGDQHVSRGTGPATHYNRHAQYFPGLRTGRGPNQNLAVLKGVRRGSPGASAGLPSVGGVPFR